MAWHVIYRQADGEAVSVGQVVADPLPAGLVDQPVSDADGRGIVDGTRRWDPVTLTVVARPQPVEETVRASLEAKADAALTANSAFLADTNVTNAEAVTQVQRLTRQVNALIRLSQFRLLTTDSDT